MDELLSYFKEKLDRNSNSSDDQIRKNTVKHAIALVCDTYLKDVGDVFTFEVLEEDLPYAISVIEEEPLKSKYIINQVSKSLFEAVLSEIEI